MRWLLCLLLPLLLLAACATDPALDKIELHALALHELGHLLGLGHVADAGRIMHPTVRNGQRLAAADIDAAKASTASKMPVCFASDGFPAPFSATLHAALAEWNAGLGTTWFSEGAACTGRFEFGNIDAAWPGGVPGDPDAIAIEGPPALIVFSDTVHWY